MGIPLWWRCYWVDVRIFITKMRYDVEEVEKKVIIFVYSVCVNIAI